MRKSFRISTGTAALLSAGFFFVPYAMAAKTGEVKITGSVPVSCDITVTQDSGAVGITDISAGATNRAVATVTETCNSRSGYRVSLATTNGKGYTGLFVDTVSNDSQPFTIVYGGNAVSQAVVTESSTIASGVQKTVAINYAANSKLTGTAAATYTETITFTIAAR